MPLIILDVNISFLPFHFSHSPPSFLPISVSFPSLSFSFFLPPLSLLFIFSSIFLPFLSYSLSISLPAGLIFDRLSPFGFAVNIFLFLSISISTSFSSLLSHSNQVSHHPRVFSSVLVCGHSSNSSGVVVILRLVAGAFRPFV